MSRTLEVMRLKPQGNEPNWLWRRQDFHLNPDSLQAAISHFTDEEKGSERLGDLFTASLLLVSDGLRMGSWDSASKACASPSIEGSCCSRSIETWPPWLSTWQAGIFFRAEISKSHTISVTPSSGASGSNERTWFIGNVPGHALAQDMHVQMRKQPREENCWWTLLTHGLCHTRPQPHLPFVILGHSMPQVLWPCRYFLSYLFCLGNPHSALKTDVKYSLSVEVFFMVLYPWMELIHLIRTLKAPYQNVHIPLQWYSLRACPTPRWDHRQSKHKICVFLTHLHFFF